MKVSWSVECMDDRLKGKDEHGIALGLLFLTSRTHGELRYTQRHSLSICLTERGTMLV
jgi:hypothetical protein